MVCNDHRSTSEYRQRRWNASVPELGILGNEEEEQSATHDGGTSAKEAWPSQQMNTGPRIVQGLAPRTQPNSGTYTLNFLTY